MIEVSHLGVQPFDILYIGLQEKFPITIGTASILIGGLLLTISYLLTKEKLKVGTILDTVFLGIFVDLFLHMDFITAPEIFNRANLFLIIWYSSHFLWCCPDYFF